MRRPLRQRETVVAVGLLLSVLGSFGAAAETKLVAACREPAPGAAGALATLACDVRANGFAAFKDVKAAIKGESADLAAKFAAFDPATQGATTAYMIQLLPNARRATLTQMGDAVVTFADARQGKRRFTAYTFANDLTLISDSGASKNEFARQVIAIKPANATVQLYKTALQAVEALAKESGERKSLVILGDGTSDDTSYGHDQVVQAAKDAGVTIHVLGYYDDRGERPNFQKLARLAEETGGYATEVKQGPGKDKDFTADVVNSRFVGEVLENGGTLTADLKGPAGDQTVVLKADLADGKHIEAEHKVTVPAAPQPTVDAPFPRTEEPPPPERSGIVDWMADNPVLVVMLGLLAGAGVVAFTARGRAMLGQGAPIAAAAGSDSDDSVTTGGEAGGEAGELLRDAEGLPVVYGWLEMLDGNASRHPLRTTNVRVGRHRDNDICLQNDSISRRHAVLHYNADTRRFVITDLGGGNGVIVNKTKYKSRELSDGDTVELGEVRLRFRAETEHLA